jgi:two-component system sensor histidine kinase UhpB
MADLVQSWNDRLGEQTHFSLRCAIAEASIADDLALTVYRLTQEALTNSVRHAHATRVAVTLESEADGRLLWSVEDDGAGIVDIDGGIQLGNGLAGMRERAWAFGCDLEIGPARGPPQRPGLKLAATFA